MKLYRPVGLQELVKVLNFGSEKFPDRQVWQPILYIVENYGYAEQIGTMWNLNDENSGFSGYMLEFDISDDYIKDYELKQVGDKTHLEYWIPAEDTERFNNNIIGKIKIVNAFYGEKYKGIAFAENTLESRLPDEQIRELVLLAKNSYEKFVETVRENKNPIVLNLLYWMRLGNNESKNILYEIEKILSQTYADYDEIIVDLKSWENTR